MAFQRCSGHGWAQSPEIAGHGRSVSTRLVPDNITLHRAPVRVGWAGGNRRKTVSDWDSEPEIAVCPGCGAQVVVLDPRLAEIDGETYLLVECETCGAEVPVEYAALEDDAELL